MRFPFTALIKKDLITNLRRTRSFVFLLLFVGIMFFIVSVAWPGKYESLIDISSRTQVMLGFIFTLLMLASGFIVTGLAAGSIVSEKEQDTFDMLRLTQISPSGIVLGKMLNVLGFYLLLIVSALPVFGVVFFLVGVDWMELAGYLAITLAFAIICALVGVAASATNRTSGRAIIRGYLYLLLIYMLSILSMTLFQNIVGSVIFIIIGCVTLFAIAVAYTGRPLKPAVNKIEKPIDDKVVLTERRRKFPYYLIDPAERKKPIDDGTNPMFAKEFRWGMANRATTLVRMTYTAAIICFMFSMADASIWIVLSVIMAPALMAGSMSPERESGNLDMLRMTLLTSRQIMMGKFYAGMISVSPLILSAAISYIIIFFLGKWVDQTFTHLATSLVTLTLCMAVSVSLGLLASLRANKTSSSVVLNYALHGILYLGAASAGGAIELICMLLLDINLHLVDSLAFFSPIAAFFEYQNKRTLFLDISFLWVSSMVMFSYFCFLIVRLSARIFEKRHMQDQ